ncbi:MAG: RAD55 family ATPase [Longimicrobiales bacterium]
MLRSGVPPVDARLGGFTAGRVHLLTGGVGAGKTTACLQFLAAGLETGATAALLTLDRPEELASHADFLGIDLARHVRVGRLELLRFRRDFTWRLAHAAPSAAMIEGLRRGLSGDVPPARVAIDPASPFLAEGAPLGPGILALARLLDELRCTSLVTYPGPLPGADRRLDALVDDAALIAELERGVDGEHALVVARARTREAPSSPIRFRIERGRGIVEPPTRRGGRRAGHVAAIHEGLPT